MLEVQRNALRDVPRDVVPVASLHSVLPLAEQRRRDLPGKEVGEDVRSDPERPRRRHCSHLRRELRRRIDVDFDLDLEPLLRGEADVVYIRRLLEERALDGGRLALVLHLDLDFLPGEPELLDDGGEVVLEPEAEVWLEQGEVHVLGKAPHAVQKPQTRASVERGLLEEASAGQPGERDLLHDLVRGIPFVRGVLLPELGNHSVKSRHWNILSRALNNPVFLPQFAYACSTSMSGSPR